MQVVYRTKFCLEARLGAQRVQLLCKLIADAQDHVSGYDTDDVMGLWRVQGGEGKVRSSATRLQ